MNMEDIFPCKKPFLFVDEIIEMKYLEYSKGKKTVKGDEFWVEAQLPNDPIFPGVLLLETMAQIGSLILKGSDQEKPNAYLSEVEKLKLIKKVIPGNEVIVEGTFIDSTGYFVKIRTKAFVQGIKVAEAEITYLTRDKLGGR